MPYSLRSGETTRQLDKTDLEKRRVDLQSKLNAATATLDTVSTMVDDLSGATENDRQIKNILGLLCAQVREMKVDQRVLKEESSDCHFKHVGNEREMKRIDRVTIQTEQYSRRDAVTVMGVEYVSGETDDDLAGKAAAAMSKCGVRVVPGDFSVIHWNGKPKTIRGKNVNPSVTARFCKIAQRDNIVRNYKNYDVAAKKARDVKVFASLSKHFSDLRRNIVDFLKPVEGYVNPEDFSNQGRKLKWCTYQSPTSGFAMKLDDGTYINGIHFWEDFEEAFQAKCYPKAPRK